MRSQRIINLEANVPFELRPPKAGRDYLSMENLAAQAVAYAEDIIPQVGLDAELAAAGATNYAAFRQWDGDEAAPQRSVWLLATAAARIKVVEGAP